MSTLIKYQDTELTEEMVQSLVHKYIKVPVNIHKNPESGEEVNAWFGGQVAGYEKAELHFDYMKNEFRDEPVTFFNILLTDGMAYVLSNEQSEIEELSKEEFDTLVMEHLAEQALQQEAEAILDSPLILPEDNKNKKLILPGEFF